VIDDFMAFAETGGTVSNTDTAVKSGVVLVPSNLSVSINAKAKNVSYNGIEIKDFDGEVLLDSNRIKLNETKFRVADAIVNINAGYSSQSPQKASFDFSITTDSFDIQKVYQQVKLFRDLASSAAKTSGIVSLDYQLKGRLNADMMPVYPSLKGGGVLRLENLKVNGLKLFTAISKTSGKDSVNNPHLKKVNIKTTIANNIITIEQVKMKVMGFRPRFEGQTSFDGRLNLKCRLGLPPFGIIGIPMSITGTSTNPIVKMKKNKETDLEERGDDEE